MNTVLPWLDAADVTRLLSPADAIAILESALVAGLDPASDPARTAVGLTHGQLLLMPSQGGDRVGVKVASVAPANPARGRPRIQAIYLLMDAETLSPLALLDGTAVTSLRTPALSAVAARHLARPDASRVVVFGTGPQAWGHLEALRAVRPLTDVVVVARDPDRALAFARRVEGTGVQAAPGDRGAVGDADVVVCATTAREPVFDGRLVRSGACVIAVGSHEPDARELDDDLMARAFVVVEDRTTALREAGDVVLAVETGRLDPDDLVDLGAVVTGAVSPDPDRPRVFKSVGMAWEDLVVSAEVHRRHLAAGHR